MISLCSETFKANVPENGSADFEDSSYNIRNKPVFISHLMIRTKYLYYLQDDESCSTEDDNIFKVFE